jgi:rhamnosyltransferase
MIVTYNPDVERLRENVSAIAPQVDGIFVYDNGSTNAFEVEELCGDYTAACCLSGRNSGVAVALNELCAAAWSLGADRALLLDQDSVASKGMVSALMSDSEAGAAIVAPTAVDCNRHESFEPRDESAPVKRAITSGSLLALSSWRTIGGYDERLFVDWVDVEFCDNLRVHGLPVMHSYRTHLLHELGHQERVLSAPGMTPDDKKDPGHAYCRQNYPLWRWHDRARAQAITIGKYAGTPIAREERWYFWKSTVGRIIVLEKGKFSKLRAAAQGWREGRAVVRGRTTCSEGQSI